MVVISQDKSAVVPFEKFVFVAGKRNSGTGAIFASPDVLAEEDEWRYREIAKYKDVDEAKKVLADMVSAYRVDCKTFELPESEV